MLERFFQQIDETRARAARDAAGTPAPRPAPAHPLVRLLGRLVIVWVVALVVLTLLGLPVDRLTPFTPLVILPGLALQIGSYAGLVPDRILGRRATREGVLLALLFWGLAALVTWVDPAIGGIASIALLLLFGRRLNRVVLRGMYVAELARIRSGRGPSERLSREPAGLDARSTGTEIDGMHPTEKETR